MARPFMFLGALSAFLSVALGAFGAHALKTRLDEYSLGVFHTGVQYQFYHALALLIVSQMDTPLIRVSGWLFVAGTVIFSGSLYALALSGVKMWGAVTPIGGVLFLIGWAVMAYTALRLGA